MSMKDVYKRQALYGVLSSPGDQTVVKADLRPALALKTRVVLIRQVPKVETVGYGPVSYTHLDVYKRQYMGCTGGMDVERPCFCGRSRD